jgi:iron complex outermembrane recepter protein
MSKIFLKSPISSSVRCVALTLLPMAATPLAAQAQDSQIQLEEVIVTARKRAESIQDIPVSVTALGAELERSTLQSLQDVQAYAPNVTITKSGQGNGAVVSIRGISFQDPDKSMESPVAIILDGVNLGIIAGGLLSNFDMERIEVLRGPQGTLFGKNTTAGALNVIRTAPTKEFGAKVKVGAGSWDKQQIQAVLNTPLTENGGLKIYANKDKHDGYLENDVIGKDVGVLDYQQLGATVAFDIGENFNLSFTAERIEDDSDAGASNNISGIATGELSCLFSLDPSPGGLAANSNAPVGSGCAELDKNSDEDHVSSDQNFSSATTDFSNLTMNWQINDSWSLTSITGYMSKEEEMLLDYDASQVDFLSITTSHEYEQFSQEVRVTGDLTDDIKLTTGLYYWDSEYDQFQESFHLWYYLGFNALPVSDVTSPLSGSGTNESTAIFASMDWQLTDKLMLNLGARYTQEERTLRTQVPGFYSQMLDLMIVPDGPEQDFKEDWNEFSPRIAVQYTINDDLMVYSSFSSGFKSGGFFARTQNVDDIRSFDPEYVDTYEIGMKSEWLENRIRFNATAFYSDYEDKQEEDVVDLGGGNVTTTVYNAADATITGLELELTAQITASLSGFINLGFLDTEFHDFDVVDLTTGQPVNQDHLILRNAPEQTVGLGLDYVAAVSFGDFGAHYNYQWRDEHEANLKNAERGHIDAGGFHNASVDLSFAENYRISVYGRNLSDERFTRAIPIGITGFGQYNEGRHYGVELTAKF